MANKTFPSVKAGSIIEETEIVESDSKGESSSNDSDEEASQLNQLAEHQVLLPNLRLPSANFKLLTTKMW